MRKLLALLAVAVGLSTLPATASALDFEPAAGSPITDADVGLTPPNNFDFTDMTTADFDGDGFGDIAVMGNYPPGIYMFMGSADGTLTPSASNPIGSTPSTPSGTRWMLQAADMDNDGDMDLVSSMNNYDNTETIETYKNGRINGGSPLVHEAFGSSPNFTKLLDGLGAVFGSDAIADINDDGFPDLVRGLKNHSYQTLLGKNDSSGSFVSNGAPVSVPVNSPSADDGISGTAFGDYNGDGDVDLVLAEQSAGTNHVNGLFFAKRNGASVFQNPPVSFEDGAPGEMFNAIETADLNGDQYDDLVFGRTAFTGPGLTSSVDTALGSATGPVINTGKDNNFLSLGPAGISIADFNKDGNNDVASPKAILGQLDVGLGDGNGGIPSALANKFSLPPVTEEDSSFSATGVETLDLNGDGLEDVAVNGNTGVDILLNVPETDISVTPASVDFGNVPEDAELIAPKQVTVKSTGNVPLTLTDPTITGPNANKFTVGAGTCGGGALEPQETCNLEVTFPQTGGLGKFTADLNIGSDAKDGAVMVPLEVNVTKGTAPPAQPKLSLTVKAPKKVNKGKEAVVTAVVKNSGTATSNAIALKATAPKQSTRNVKAIKAGPLGRGKSLTRKFRIPVKRSAKGKFKVKVVLSSGGKTITRSTGMIKIVGTPR